MKVLALRVHWLAPGAIDVLHPGSAYQEGGDREGSGEGNFIHGKTMAQGRYSIFLNPLN